LARRTLGGEQPQQANGKLALRQGSDNEFAHQAGRANDADFHAVDRFGSGVHVMGSWREVEVGSMVRECGSGQSRLSGVESEWTNDDCGSRTDVELRGPNSCRQFPRSLRARADE